MRPRRVLLVGAGWVVATGLATVLAWRAVELVSSEVTERPAVPLSDDQVARALGTGAAAPATTGTTETVPGPGATGPEGTSTSARAPATSPSTATSTSTAGPAPTATPTTSTTSTTMAPAVTRTLVAQGGQVAVRYADGGVELLWARPESGFTVDVEKAGPDEVDVRFESDDHRSRVRAFWRNGVPAEEVREEDA